MKSRKKSAEETRKPEKLPGILICSCLEKPLIVPVKDYAELGAADGTGRIKTSIGSAGNDTVCDCPGHGVFGGGGDIAAVSEIAEVGSIGIFASHQPGAAIEHSRKLETCERRVWIAAVRKAVVQCPKPGFFHIGGIFAHHTRHDHPKLSDSNGVIGEEITAGPADEAFLTSPGNFSLRPEAGGHVHEDAAACGSRSGADLRDIDDDIFGRIGIPVIGRSGGIGTGPGNGTRRGPPLWRRA